MTRNDAEERRLRAAALKNAASIKRARQRAERELVAAKEALERKTLELDEQHSRLEAALRALRASEERLRAMFEQAAIGIGIAGLDGHFVEVNQQFANIVGYTPDELRGLGYADITHPDDLADTHARVRRLLAGEFPHYAHEKRYVRKDGAVVWSRTTVTGLHNASGQIEQFIGVIEDITARVEAEATLRDTDRRKDEFLATLAHELRNPLAPIHQSVLVLKSATASEQQKLWSHDVIARQVRHMALLLDDLLDISRITRGTLALHAEMTELAAVVEAAVETARPAIDAKRHILILELPPEPVWFTADPLRIAQVLSNLLTNAARYTEPHGRIRLRAGGAADGVTIVVADTGIGIPEGELEDLFTMFTQGKANSEHSEGGLGIGLALAKGLVELHGGTIEVKSAGIGRGSEFCVRLPLAQDLVSPRSASQAAAANIVATPPVAADSPSKRVLVADDNRDAAETLATLLRMEGHDVTVVYDGRAALDAFKATRPDAALLDIGMPKLNGYEVARRIREIPSGRGVLLVAVTGWGQDGDKAQAYAAGFDRHFTKPVSTERLSELLRPPAEPRA